MVKFKTDFSREQQSMAPGRLLPDCWSKVSPSTNSLHREIEKGDFSSPRPHPRGCLAISSVLWSISLAVPGRKESVGGAGTWTPSPSPGQPVVLRWSGPAAASASAPVRSVRIIPPRHAHGNAFMSSMFLSATLLSGVPLPLHFHFH